MDKVAALSCLLALAWLGLQPTGALDNGLALRPPMGWLAWERYVCETNCSQYPGECIDFHLFAEMAQRLVDDGYKQVGYEYVNIDDCWSTRKRNDQTRRLEPDPERFPAQSASIGQLAERVHSLGLKLGIYGDCGTKTCQGFPGQLSYADNLTDNFFQLDADSFAEWQVDSFKFDGCYLNVSRAAQMCPLMGEALNKTRRPMLFSCSWPAYENDEHLQTNWSLVVERCNLWRAFGDIEDSWASVLDTIDYFVRNQELVLRYHGPGHWFDADQLVVGDFGLSLDQERAQMAVWCVWASPLYMSNDLRTIGKESAKILRNKWAIAVNQDPMGVFGLMVHQWFYLQVFVKPIEPVVNGCPSYALVYLDRRTLGSGRNAAFRLRDLLQSLHRLLAKVERWSGWSGCADRNVSLTARDLFNGFAPLGRKLNLASDYLELRVNPSGVRMIHLAE